MKTLAKLLLSVLALASPAFGQSSNAVWQLPLDPLRAVPIPVGIGYVTTVRFPSPIAGLDAAFVATNAESLFQLVFHPGASFFSLRALATNASANVNVIWNQQTYVLKLEESARPALSVIFTRGVSGIPGSARETPLLAQARLLARAKALDANTPITPGYRHLHSVWGSLDFEVITEEAFQFKADQMVVFHLCLSNRLDVPFHFMPLGFSVENNRQHFHPTASDGTGVIAPKSSVSVFVAVPETPTRRIDLDKPVRVVCAVLGPEGTNDVARAWEPQTITIPQ